MLRAPVCCATPPKVNHRHVVKVHHIKKAITQARNLCFNYEDTIECRLAWEKVEELSSSLHRQKTREAVQELDDSMWWDPLELRMYDI
jgi:CP12 domain